jgi:hypothetical protein
MAGIFDIFKSAPAPTTPAPTPEPSAGTQNTNPTVPNDNTVKSDGSVAAIPKASEGDKSPLANFADLWKTDPNAKKATPASPAFDIDPAKIAEAAKKIDFTAGISQDAKDKAAKGDISQLVAEATQASFAVAMQTTAGMVNQALSQQAETFQKQVLPEALRKHSLSGAVREHNPIFDNPAIKPFQGALESAISAKNPGFTPEQVAEKAGEFLTAMSEEILKGAGKSVVQTPNPSAASPKEQDWGAFFGVSAT